MSETPIATEKGRRTEQAFVRAARTVFAEKGYLATKISDIAAAAGRSPGSFYNYHESKRQLLEHLLEEFQTRVLEDTRANLTADPAQNIDSTVRAYWSSYRDYLPEMIGAFQLSMTDPTFAAWWRSRRAQGIEVVPAGIRRLMMIGLISGHFVPHKSTAISPTSMMILD